MSDISSTLHMPKNETGPELTVDGAIATIRFRNPDYANRLSPNDLLTLRDYISVVNQSKEVLVLRFVGEGKYFCSGYDISSLAATSAPSSLFFGKIIDLIESARPVTIAAINGGAYGGGTDICLACDFRIGVPAANMFMPAAKLGLHFYPGGMARYISRLGLNQAKRLFLTAEKIEAEEMLRIGFLTEIVEDDQLAARLDELSQLLAGMAPISLLGIKKHLNLIAKAQVEAQDIEEGVRLSESSSDILEGALAWKEKRLPQFKGI
ncbi:3-hydroxybutyryl-CoA dehydratase [Advenella faeciporci]|uniref:3-hydroxybutyryl-CoA dehydratase n=2 Tax=Advenella faeciporci TaxID=797535 RepID=A0A918JT75_9BURK|nr:3-hydroxybutyryl-CoA dehydratase [Advenella faeciporci]